MSGSGREDDSLIGSTVGAYRIVSEIGRGGMGVVYLAERAGEFTQQAALKILRRGMDSGLVVARFRYERQILAALNHPNIARLLDGGATADGMPYFVMEYVAGAAPIDAYCAARGLNTRQRLQLFRGVCAAVQYAHQQLVVHRDIKPGNILVTPGGTPKLLDFGIAKLLRQDDSQETAGLTQMGVRQMTPQYASPEQVRGLPVSVATDVYSLGMVLYLLLAGRLPYGFEGRSLAEIERVVCEQEPSRGVLEGDLDNIVLKALEKDPQRRYGSVEQLSEDLRRYLEGLPVSARPQTLGYRARKFARRNRAAAIAAAAVLISLAGGLAASLVSAHAARQERARAERRFNDVRRLANSFLFEFHDRIKDLPGAIDARRLIVAKALEYLDSLASEAAGDTGLEVELSEAYVRLGDVQGNPYQSNLGDAKAALASYDKAARVLGPDPRHSAARLALARANEARSAVLPLAGREAEALASARKAVEAYEGLVKSELRNVPWHAALAGGLESLGDTLARAADSAGAARSYRRALETWDVVLGFERRHTRGRRAVAVLAMKLGDLEMDVERVEAAQALYNRALERMDGGGDPEGVRIAASIRRKLAYAISYQDVPRALVEYRAASAALERLIAADPRNSRTRMDLAIVLRETGELQENLPAEKRGALDSYRRTLEQLNWLEAADDSNLRLKQYIAEIHLRMARLLPPAEAAKASARGIELARKLASRPGATPRDMAFCAEVLLRAEPPALRDPETALKYLLLLGDKNPNYLDLMAEAHYQAGRAQQAVELERRALGLLPPESAGRAQLERHLRRYEGRK